jgi:serine/threonine-protein kinase
MGYSDRDADTLVPKQLSGCIGRYQLVAEVARGGMGIVYLALVRGPGRFNKLFVLKTLKEHLAEDPNVVSMFLDEGRLAAKLSHPNVVQTIEVGSDGGRHFIAMEHLDGQPHSRVLSRSARVGARMPLHYQLHVISRLLEGLEYAHEATDFDGRRLGLVHRDVSPCNVFLTYDGQVKILDFGIAKALDSVDNTRTGVLKGKVAYMAPEQATGGPIDLRADIFSAGVMLWEAAAETPMWKRALNNLQILNELANGRTPQLRDAAPDVDDSLEYIVLKATAADPSHRYASATEMRRDVDTYLQGLETPPIGAREIGKLVGDLFVQDRANIKGIVDSQLRTVASAPPGAGTAGAPERASPSGASPSVTPPGLARTTGALVVPTPAEPQRTWYGSEDDDGTGPSVSNAPWARPPRRAPRLLTIVATVVSILGLAGAAAAVRGARQHRGAADSPPSPAAVAVPAATASPGGDPPPTVAALGTEAQTPQPDTPAGTATPAPPSAATGTATADAQRPAPHAGDTRRGAPKHAPPRAAPRSAAAPPVISHAAPPSPPAVPAGVSGPTTPAHVRQTIDTTNPYVH